MNLEGTPTPPLHKFPMTQDELRAEVAELKRQLAECDKCLTNARQAYDSLVTSTAVKHAKLVQDVINLGRAMRNVEDQTHRILAERDQFYAALKALCATVKPSDDEEFAELMPDEFTQRWKEAMEVLHVFEQQHGS